MEDLFLGLVGISMFYSWIHFAFIQHAKVYENRTQYEKAVTWYAITTLLLFIYGSI